MPLADVLKSLEEKISFKKDATIGGIKFGLSLLTYEQDQTVSSFPEESEDPMTFYERTRIQVLSYAIKSIDNESIPEIVGVSVGDKEETKERAIYIKELLKKLPQKVIDKLFEVYIDFKDEIDTKLNNDMEYKWYKTPEERKMERKFKEEDKTDKEEPVIEEKPITFTEVKEKDEPV